MLNWILIFFIIVILLLVCLYNIINANEDKALFFPSKRKGWKPKVPYREVFLNVKDRNDVCYRKDRKKNQEYIVCWHFNNFPGKKCCIFSHGNSGNLSHRQYIVDMCTDLKLNLLIYDYRGFGESDSYPSKKFIKEDAEIAFEYLTKHCAIPNKEIIIWGESLGGLAAVWTAHKYECGGLILFSTFSSLDDAITYRYKKGGTKTAAKLLTDFLSFRMDMLPLKHYLRKVKCPVVVVHSEEDTMIPYACSKINFHSIRHKKKLHVKIKGDHSSPNITSDQLKKIFDFCELPLDDLSSDVDITELLQDLRGFAKKHNNFMSF